MSYRIVFLNRSFYPDITATGQLLTELCEDLVKDYGCSVTVIASRPLITEEGFVKKTSKAKLIEKENYLGIEILRVKSTIFSRHSFLGRLSNYLTYFFLSFFASFELEKPDLVVALTDPPIIGMIGLWVRRRFNIPLLISVRDIFPEAGRSLEGSENKIISFILEKVNRLCFKKASYVIALGRLMQSKLIEGKGVSPDKISIIPDWADSSLIYPAPKENPFSVSNGISGYFVVMYSGNIGATSGLDVLIECAHLLKGQKDILFEIIGEGIRKGSLMEQALRYQLDNVRFLPFQPKRLLAYSFSSADVFIVSLKKGMAGFSLPSKIYGIMASGRPYVACVELDSEVAIITRQFNCGLIACPDDPKDLADKVLLLYNNRGMAEQLGRNARDASAVFERAKGVRQYYELFKRVLQHKKEF